MNRIAFLIAFLLSFSTISLFGQQKEVNLYDSAYFYYLKKDFKRAAKFYDSYYENYKGSQNNYGTYYAAVAYCHAGMTEKAKYYIKRSGQIGYDYPMYNAVLNDSLNICLRDFPEWKKYIGDFKFKADSNAAAIKNTAYELSDQSKRVNSSPLTDRIYLSQLYKENNAAELMAKIRSFNSFPIPGAKGNWTLYQMKINDTLTVPYLLYIPAGYNPKQKAPLYVYLHGGVINKPQFAITAYIIPNGREIKVTDKVKQQQQAFILYPLGNKNFNWLFHQAAFEMVMNEITNIKSLYNINDNQVYIGGHSNGGQGAFWFAINKQFTFSSFYCFNYWPLLFKGNTALGNLNNAQKVFGISSIGDENFPITQVTDIYKIGIKNGANWKNYTFHGDHELSVEHRDSINFIFDSLKMISRNPFPTKIQWETDDIRNGRNAWIEITQLDTLAQKENWQNELNTVINKDGKTYKYNFTKHKSGAVLATADNNVVRIQSSRIKELALYVSPDQFDLKKKIQVYVNGRLIFDKKINPDKDVIFNEFIKTKDRSFIAAAKIILEVRS